MIKQTIWKCYNCKNGFKEVELKAVSINGEYVCPYCSTDRTTYELTQKVKQ